MKKYYLAYGSNLNLEHMAHNCPFAKPMGRVMIEGYRLAYKGTDDGVSYLTIEEDPNSCVPMGLFQVSVLDICYLDMYEGYPTLYKKEYMDVTFKGRKKKALIYVMNKEFDYHIPSDRYVLKCEEGYRDFKFNIEFLDDAYKYTVEHMKQKQLIKEKKDF